MLTTQNLFRPKRGKLFTLLIAVFGLALSTVMVQKRHNIINKAYVPSSCGQLSLKISLDGKNSTNTLLEASTKITRYYVHVAKVSDNTGCEANLDIKTRYCLTKTQNGYENCVNLGSSPWKVLPFGAYRSDSSGLLRADFKEDTHKVGYWVMQVRPYGSNAAYSNEVALWVNNSNYSQNNLIDASQYYIQTPGFTYVYKTDNYKYSKTGTTTIQYEQMVRWWNRINVLPWRYWKDDSFSYWNPSFTGSTGGMFLQSLRFFVADFNSNFAEAPSFNNYMWSPGHIRYLLEQVPGQSSILQSDFAPSKFATGYYTGVTSGDIPGYTYMKKRFYDSYFLYQDKAAYRQDDMRFSPLQIYLPAAPQLWLIRADIQNISINNQYFKYSGPALKIDQYEANLLRETWYFVKNVGLVEIRIKHFNNYGNVPSPECSDDSDCYSDNIQNPYIKVSLEKYFHNPKLTVSAARRNDFINEADLYVVSNESKPYLISPAPYTGYLDVLDASGKIYPGTVWVKDGRAAFTTAITNSLPVRFRINIPDNKYPNETRISGVQAPWSDPVTIGGIAASNCRTGVWYAAPGYETLNWCSADTYCHTGWVSNASQAYSCPVGTRLQNVGIYCTRADGKKAYTGSSKCVPN